MAVEMYAHPSVLVLGGGIAGTSCARELAKHDVHVTLVDRHNYNQFQPLLYQVATAQVGASAVARPLRGMFRKAQSVNVKMATVTDVDPVTRTVTCHDGTTFRGDYLVLATGGEANFFHTPGAQEHAFPLYGLQGAERLRSRLFEVFEDTDRDPSLLEQGSLNIVVVGAGATGVEVSGALADLINDVMPGRFRDCAVDSARVHLVDPAPVVLAPFSDRAHTYAERILEQKGVQLELGRRVTEIKADRVVLSDGREILTRVVVWAGGIKASGIASQFGLPQGQGGRIDVQPDLTVRGFDHIFVLGDVANTLGADDKALPQLGSVAMQAGRSAAQNIVADIEGRARVPFAYRDKGIMAMIGRNAAVAEVGAGRRELHGAPAFASWLGVHAVLLPGFRQRMNAVRSWAWDYFSKSRATSIIDRPDAAQIDWSSTSEMSADQKPKVEVPS
jgi:NADH:ubiquinone reductase (H+-translocating)